MLLEIYGKSPNYSGHGEYQRGTDPALRQCPFCGGHDVTVGNTHTPSYFTECEDCGAEGPSASFNGRVRSKAGAEKAHREAFAEAIRKWNRRMG